MQKIPKVIHYCWFGKGNKSELISACINSWKIYLPDYEIREWNEENFNLASNFYVQQAYDSKKWAFVSDYVRLWAVLKFGGIYLDTDVEIKASLDEFLIHEAFTGFENPFSPFTAVFGAMPNHPWIRSLLEKYDGYRFIDEFGNENLTTNVTTTSEFLIANYGVKLNNKKQALKNGLIIYPSNYFCLRGLFSKQNYAIHHFDSSWLKIPFWKRLLIKCCGSKGRYYFIGSFILQLKKSIYRGTNK